MCIPASGGHARHTQSIAFSRHARVDPTDVSRLATSHHQHHRMHHRRHSLHAWYSWHASRVFFSGLRFRICRPFIFWRFPSIFFNFREIFGSYLTGAFSMMRISHAFFLCIYFHFALLPEASCTLLVALPGGFFSPFFLFQFVFSACGCAHRHAVPPSALMCLICLVWCVMCLSSRFLAVHVCMCAV